MNGEKSLIKLIGLFSLYLMTVGFAHADLFIHQLKHQPASSAIPVIQPHLSSDTRITAKGFQLFVSGSKEDNDKIISILKIIDTQTREYLIEVRILDHRMQNPQPNSTRLNKHNQSTNIEIRHYQIKSSDQSNHLFTLRVIENHQAFVSTGESFPSNQIQSQYGHLLPTTGRTNVTSGFYLIVHGQGNEDVSLSLSAQQQQRQSGYGQSITSSSTSTKVSGKKGNWILVASNTNNSQSKSSRSYRTSSKKNKERWYYIRVSDSVSQK